MNKIFIDRMLLFKHSLMIERFKIGIHGKVYLNVVYRNLCCDKGKRADLAIIGVGPAGLFGSLRAKQNGIKHMVVLDQLPTMGGTCINYGCIPTKCLLNYSHSYHQVKSGLFALQGVITSDVKLDLEQMMKTKSKVMKDLSDYMQGVFKNLGIPIIRGKARIHGCNQIAVDGNDGKKSIIEAEKILIATGSVSRPFPGIEIDEKQIVSSTGAVNLRTVPENLIIIGAGIIAIELGYTWACLGSKVTMITVDSTIIGPKMDKDIKAKYQKIMEGKGLKFIFNTKVLGAEKCGKCVKIKTADKDGCNVKEQECDVVLVAVGRVPQTDGLNLERVGIETDEAGFIPVHQNYETCCPGFYAAGDVIRGPMTAHKAIEDGILVIDGMCGKVAHLNINHIPLVIYTHPEAASVGKTEEELQEECHPYKVLWTDFKTCARARTELDTTGYIKALICKKTRCILGTHIIGEHAGEIINEVTVAQQYGLTADHLARVVHAHPTYAKMLKSVFSH